MELGGGAWSPVGALSSSLRFSSFPRRGWLSPPSGLPTGGLYCTLRLKGGGPSQRPEHGEAWPLGWADLPGAIHSRGFLVQTGAGVQLRGWARLSPLHPGLLPAGTVIIPVADRNAQWHPSRSLRPHRYCLSEPSDQPLSRCAQLAELSTQPLPEPWALGRLLIFETALSRSRSQATQYMTLHIYPNGAPITPKAM